MNNSKVCFNKSVGILTAVTLFIILGLLFFSQIVNRQTSTDTKAYESCNTKTSKATCKSFGCTWNETMQICESVLQRYFDTVKKDAEGYGGECRVSSDCMPPDVCIGKKVGDKMIGSCVTPTPKSTRPSNRLMK